MRILFYDKSLINLLQKEENASGGAAVQTFGWARGLKEIGNDVWLLTNPAPSRSLKEESLDFNLIPLFDEKKGIRWLRWIYYRFPDTYKKIKKVRPDYLYQSVPGWACFLIGIMCKQLKVKYILRISNDYFLDERFHRLHSPFQEYFMKKGMKMTDCILCQNDYQLGIIQRNFPNKKVVKIANPIIYQNNGQLSQATSERGYIAWLGIFQYQKNLHLLYEIASKLKNEQFWIAGKETNKIDNATLQDLKRLKTLPNVTFMGFLSRKEVPPFLKNAKYLLNTSHYEGFSNTFLEAMVVGTPILSTENVNPDGIIDGYQLGLIYKDANGLARLLEEINPESYRQMSENVIRYVDKNHHYKVLARKLVDILHQP
ncbi:glycosyltransferase [Echinicola jeungdonensis]|uniref:Glycosyltransferase family 4 protein n=1 Tax=Echinicola jeungdonensis TaxID=709343 RepID=A0ABV5J144_9BACT|nr:glycosyltransferase [Echinicola jeungdonensis]MDN3671152.1 glycosyltransferase [Echinicola jeungdonensis]